MKLPVFASLGLVGGVGGIETAETTVAVPCHHAEASSHLLMAVALTVAFCGLVETGWEAKSWDHLA